MPFWFWRKRPRRTYTDPELGELEQEVGFWGGSKRLEGIGELLIDIEGDGVKPEESRLQLAKSILSQFGTYLSAAKNYLKTQDLGSQFGNPEAGELTIDGFWVMKEQGVFELHFGLSKWPDASITVIFRGGHPVEVMCGD